MYFAVSKLRVLRSLRSAQVPIDADVQILLHAMRLDHDDTIASQHLSDDEYAKDQRTRYQQVKTALFAIEQSARFSTNFLAAQALLALHEIGHGIFPAAYLTVGNLARLFCALGLHDRKKATQILPRPGMSFFPKSHIRNDGTTLTLQFRNLVRNRRATTIMVGSPHTRSLRPHRLPFPPIVYPKDTTR
jgi:hypothetical protein